jgi:hypothetical protein
MPFVTVPLIMLLEKQSFEFLSRSIAENGQCIDLRVSKIGQLFGVAALGCSVRFGDSVRL